MSRMLCVKGRTLDLTTPQIMGILNVTPDSFSDGGKFNSLDKAYAQAERMKSEGAAIIDIGGESTRPGADLVSLQEELDRVIPVVEKVSANLDVMISIDTSTPEVMEEAVKAGAHIWNDIRALQRPHAVESAAKLDIAVCLMHMQGDPKTMQTKPHYEHLVPEVCDFLLERAQVCEAAGIPSERIILDPGFGFGKSVMDNYRLLAHFMPVLNSKTTKDYHLLYALSRKSMLGAVINQAVASERVNASVLGAFYSLLQGAHMVRVHDVKPSAEAIAIFKALQEAQQFSPFA